MRARGDGKGLKSGKAKHTRRLSGLGPKQKRAVHHQIYSTAVVQTRGTTQPKELDVWGQKASPQRGPGE